MYQIALKLITGETESLIFEDKDEVGIIMNIVAMGKWVRDVGETKTRCINGKHVVKITVTEKITSEREVIKK